MILLILGICMAAYVFCRSVLPLRCRWQWKAAFSVLLAVAAFKFHVLYLFGGPKFFAPDVPGAVQMAATGMFTALLFFFFLSLAADVVRGGWLLVRVCRKRRASEGCRKGGNRVNLALLAVALCAATFGMVQGHRVPEVREKHLFVNHLPEECEGMSIAVLADLHVDHTTSPERIREIVRRTNAAKPDMVVIVGDFVDGSIEDCGEAVQPLADLRARFGVFGVPGNHEYYSGYREWMAHLSRLGIRMLCNGHVLADGGRIAVAGVTDPMAARSGGDLPDAGKALEGCGDDAFKLILVHQPRLAADSAAQGADLQISGHTHGGMLLGVDRLIAAFNEGYVSGEYQVEAMVLHVSNGTCIWNGFPVRIGVPSEIGLLHLYRRK